MAASASESTATIWRVGVEVDGSLDENYYVFDFIALKDRSLEIVQELDHRMLVAMKNPLLPVSDTTDEVQIRYRNKRWIFPREDCVLLPIENTTAELLAKYIAERLLNVLQRQHHYVPQAIRVDVEECFGQIATYSKSVQ